MRSITKNTIHTCRMTRKQSSRSVISSNPRKSKKHLEFKLPLFVHGLIRVRSVLLELHMDNVSTIDKIFSHCLISLYLLHRFRNKSIVTVESLPPNKWMILKDKSLFSDKNSLITSWFQMSLRVLIGKEKVFKPFWNDHCQEISQRLWSPIGTDYVDLRLNSWNSSSISMIPDSSFLIKKQINPQIESSPMTSFLSSMSIPVDPWVKDRIRTRKVRIYPTSQQQQTLRQWMGTCRYIYNRSLHNINQGNEPNPTFFSLRNKYVTAKDNTVIHPWESETPKDIRAGALQDLSDRYLSLCKMVKERKLTHFKMKYRRKHDDASILIPMKTIDIKSGAIQIYKKKYNFPVLKTSKRQSRKIRKWTATHDCRLQYQRGRWFMCIPLDVEHVPIEHRHEDICALDPGVRKFQVIYSPKEVVHVGIRRELRAKIYRKIDELRSLRSKKQISKTRWKKREDKLRNKLSDLTDELHYQTANYLTKTYKAVFIPPFESQDMVRGKGLTRTTKRRLLDYKHYTFRTRLERKCRERGCVFKKVTEEYTSKTCSSCGHVKTNLGASEVYKCETCHMRMDRDTNGAKNILIKVIDENQKAITQG